MRVQVRAHRGEWTFAETDKLLVLGHNDKPHAVKVEKLQPGDIVVGLGKILQVDVVLTREEEL